MPFASQIESVDMKGWAGGLNREADPNLLEVNEVPDCLNVDFGLRGEVSKRAGYVTHTSNNSTAVFGTNLFQWTKTGGADWFIYVDQDNGGIFYTSGTALTQAGITFGAASDARDYSVSAASLMDVFYVTSTRGGPKKFDGTTFSNMTATNFDGTANRFAKAKIVHAAHERIFAFNVQNATGTEWRSRIHWSNPLVPDTWDALDYWDVSPDDGQEITAATLFGESFIVFKNNSMFMFAGTSENEFVLYPIDENLGTECPGTVTNSGAELLWLDHHSGVWMYNGSDYKKIDDKINAYLLDGINKSVAYKAKGFVHRGRYYLSVPWGASSWNNRTFVYDGRIQAWTEYDFGFADAAALDGDMYTVGPANKVGIFKMWGTSTDGQQVGGGTADNITGYFKTLWISPEEPTFKYRLRRLDMALAASGAPAVTVNMRRDYSNDVFVSQTIDTSSGGAVYDTAVWDTDTYGTGRQQVLVRSSGWGTDESVRWRTMQLEVSDNSALPYQVNRMVLQVSKIGRLRGEP